MVINNAARRPSGTAPVPGDLAAPESPSPASNGNPAAELLTLLQDMVRQPQFADCPFEPEQMAAWLQECVKSPALDLSRATQQHARFVRAMPPQVWAALHAAAGGITSVTLSAELSTGGELLVEGLKQLDTLRSLFISVPAAGEVEIDFGRLQGPALQGRSIGQWTLYVEQLGDPRSALNITVPTMARVELTNEAARTAQPRLLKPLVQYMDSDHVVTGEQHPLHGLVYDRTATDFVSASRGELGPQVAQYRARQVVLADSRAPLSPGHPSGEQATRVEPWDAAQLWLVRRQAHQRQKKADPAASERFSYRGIAASLKRHVYQHGPADLERVLAQGSRTWFAPDTFGAAVAFELRDMFVGESHYFAVRTGRGMLAIELHVKENSWRLRPSYVVNLHDPLHPGLHQRQEVKDLSRLEQMGLEKWLTGPVVADHFKDAPIGRLYPWPPRLARPQVQAPVSIHVPAHLEGSGALLYTALDDGHVAQVRHGIARMLATHKSSDSLERDLLAAGPDGRVGLHEAIRSRANTYSGAVKAYVEEVLRTDALHVPAKLRLLQVRYRDQAWLDLAVTLGRADGVRAFATGVLASGLAVEDKAKLLTLDADASGWPMLASYWTAEPQPPLGPPRLAQLDAVSAYLSTILGSRHLPPPAKVKMCAAAYGGGTPFLVSRPAMETGNPGLAGALMLGILDAEVQVGVKDALLKSLGVSPTEVVDALAALPHPGDRAWADAMIARIRDHGGPVDAGATAVRRAV